jgi:hypothetical protein
MSPSEVNMADPTAVKYVRDNLDKGVAVEDIKSSLRQSGWPEQQISEAVAEVQGAAPQPGPPAEAPAPEQAQTGEKKGGHKKLIVAVIVFIILFVLFLYVALSIVMDFKDMFPGAGDAIPVSIPFIT